MTSNLNGMVPPDTEDEIDGCDVDFALELATEDADLPETSGGVVLEEEVDGCDVDFTVETQTTDEDLPVTTGGVA